MSRVARSLLVAVAGLTLGCSGAPQPPASTATPSLMVIDPAEAKLAGTLRDDNGLKMKFRRCPSGSFRMGEKARATDVQISHPYWIGQFEVTQSEWQKLMGTTVREQRAKDPDQPRPMGDGSTRDHVGEGPEYPIYFVNYIDALEFCQRLNHQERKAGRLPDDLEYRLPSEAEWEFACRAGTTTASSFGNALGGLDANLDGSKPYGGAPVGPYLKQTTPVGRYPANAWGLHDMHGNVWEWCLDGWVEALPSRLDPVGSYDSPWRIYRGGCWHNPASLCLSTSRAWGDPEDRGSGLGFRVALGVLEKNP